MKLYLRKNKKALENEKVPYFTLLAVPEEKGGDWLEVASFWKGKKLMEDGTVAGYNGLIQKDAVIDVSKVVPYKRQEPREAAEDLSEADKAAIAESEYNKMGD